MFSAAAAAATRSLDSLEGLEFAGTTPYRSRPIRRAGVVAVLVTISSVFLLALAVLLLLLSLFLATVALLSIIVLVLR